VTVAAAAMKATVEVTVRMIVRSRVDTIMDITTNQLKKLVSLFSLILQSEGNKIGTE
jgi:hypothetical protein